MANPIQDAFESIQADDSLKASTKEFLHEYRQRHHRPVSSYIKCMSVAVLTVLVLLIGVVAYHTVSNTPVSYISIDVNPSIELTLNRWDKVITAKAYNDDGSEILSTLSVKGMSYTDAIDVIIDSDAMQPYLKNDNTLTFTAASDNEEQEEKLLLGISNCAGCRNNNGESYKADTSLVETAHENGLSLGKYCAYLELSKYDANVTPEDCRDMTMAQIRNRIRECQSGADESDSPGSIKTGNECNTNGQNQGGQYKKGQNGKGGQCKND